jgi:hypothetical protein
MQVSTTASSGVAAIAKFATLRKELLVLDMVGLLGLVRFAAVASGKEGYRLSLLGILVKS